jgi:CheY-like chemotaxis protein
MTRRLLLVDDEDAIRTIARISLERIAGWAVIPVASGQAALEADDDDGPFDAVLLDVMMRCPGSTDPPLLRVCARGRSQATYPSFALPPKPPPPIAKRCMRSAPPASSASPLTP